MSKKHSFRVAGFIVLFALLTSYQIAFAHEGVSVGDYEIEIGWVNEPPIAGQQS